jgi:hypothetical protein
MSSNPAHPAPADDAGKTGARLVAAAMIIVGFVGVYFGWHFTAMWSPSSDGNMLGTGWVLEAAFWTLREIPGVALFGVVTILGALALHGMALPSKRRSE